GPVPLEEPHPLGGIALQRVLAARGPQHVHVVLIQVDDHPVVRVIDVQVDDVDGLLLVGVLLVVLDRQPEIEVLLAELRHAEVVEVPEIRRRVEDHTQVLVCFQWHGSLLQKGLKRALSRRTGTTPGTAPRRSRGWAVTSPGAIRGPTPSPGRDFFSRTAGVAEGSPGTKGARGRAAVPPPAAPPAEGDRPLAAAAALERLRANLLPDVPC